MSGVRSPPCQFLSTNNYFLFMSQYNDHLLHAFSLGYRVSENGDVVRDGRKIGLQNPGGYLVFRTKLHQKTITVFVHRLQAYQKYGEEIFKQGIESRHKDGNSLNNAYDNILIGTHSQNMFDIPLAIRKSKAVKGAEKVRRFTPEQIDRIRQEKNQGFSLRQLAGKYETCKSTISYIVNRKTYNLED